MTKVMGFDAFADFLSESAYNIPDVNPTSEGGYELVVVGPSVEDQEERVGKIYVAKQNDKSMGLSFLGKNGKERDCLWIPKEAMDIKDSDGALLIKIRPYSKWMTNPQNTNLVEDFIEDFADHVETSKIWGSDRMKREAQDDIEILLDLFDHQASIKSFEKCGENQWDAELEDGRVIEITKRNPDDLMATFKIFTSKNASTPVLTIMNKNSNSKTIFDLDGVGKVEFDGTMLGLRNQTPYFKYLIKKCLGSETSSDQSEFYDYCQNKINKQNYKSQEVKMMLKLLADFLDQSEISSLIPGSL